MLAWTDRPAECHPGEQAFFDRPDVRPGCVISLQTFGGYGANFNRFYGAYSNRGRALRAPARADNPASGIPALEPDNSDFSREARSTWARLIRKIFEADPLTCACGARRRIVSIITDPRIVDRILRQGQSDRCRTGDLFEPRAPPISRPHTVQLPDCPVQTQTRWHSVTRLPTAETYLILRKLRTRSWFATGERRRALAKAWQSRKKRPRPPEPNPDTDLCILHPVAWNLIE